MQGADEPRLDNLRDALMATILMVQDGSMGASEALAISEVAKTVIQNDKLALQVIRDGMQSQLPGYHYEPQLNSSQNRIANQQ